MANITKCNSSFNFDIKITKCIKFKELNHGGVSFHSNILNNQLPHSDMKTYTSDINLYVSLRDCLEVKPLRARFMVDFGSVQCYKNDKPGNRRCIFPSTCRGMHSSAVKLWICDAKVMSSNQG